MPQVGFEHTILVSELVKTVHALDRAATEIGLFLTYLEEKGHFIDMTGEDFKIV
jgi:hypothetical protein